MRVMQTLLRIFFQLLYHPFAWAYDLVAGLVSLGRWKSWVLCGLPLLAGRVLEIGFGPGHLQAALQAGVGPGEIADCANRYPEVFDAWLNEMADEGVKEKARNHKVRSQELLAGLKARMGMKT